MMERGKSVQSGAGVGVGRGGRRRECRLDRSESGGGSEGSSDGREERRVIEVQRRGQVTRVLLKHGRREELRVGAVVLEAEGRLEAAIQCVGIHVEGRERREHVVGRG